MKPATFRFWFLEEPDHATPVDRAWVAHALRAYRRQRGRYLLRRAGLHRYTIVHNNDVAVISL